MPFIRYSTATSGFPCDARRQALTSASGNPIAVRFATISGGNESIDVEAGAAAGAEVVSVDVVVFAAGGVLSSVPVAVDGAGVFAVVVLVVASVSAGAGAAAAGAGAGVADGLAAFFALDVFGHLITYN